MAAATDHVLLDTRIAGVPLRVERGFAVMILGLAAANTLLGMARGPGDLGATLLASAAAALLVALSVLVHELGHAAAADARGVATDEVRLVLGGGHHRPTLRPGRTPADHLWIVAGGPLATLVLLVAAVVVAQLTGTSLDPLPSGGREPSTWDGVLFGICVLNAIVLAQALVPRDRSDGRQILDLINGKPVVGEIWINLPLSAGLHGPQVAAWPDAPSTPCDTSWSSGRNGRGSSRRSTPTAAASAA
jgi:hypothetical protein